MTGITPYSTALQQIGYGSNRQTTTAQRRTTTDKDSVKNGKSGATGSVEAGRQTSVDKPVWNSRQVFNYIEDMGAAGIAYGEEGSRKATGWETGGQARRKKAGGIIKTIFQSDWHADIRRNRQEEFTI